MDDLSEATKDREDLKQKCHDLENTLKLVEDEKSNLIAELEQLHKQVVSERS